jgi:hypothetical protein
MAFEDVTTGVNAVFPNEYDCRVSLLTTYLRNLDEAWQASYAFASFHPVAIDESRARKPWGRDADGETDEEEADHFDISAEYRNWQSVQLYIDSLNIQPGGSPIEMALSIRGLPAFAANQLYATHVLAKVIENPQLAADWLPRLATQWKLPLVWRDKLTKLTELLTAIQGFEGYLISRQSKS